jgi:hypothetical protein
MVKEDKNYLAKVKLTVTDEVTLKEKKVTEQYLVEAISVSDAETKIYKEFEGYGAFEVTSVTETKIIKLIK